MGEFSIQLDRGNRKIPVTDYYAFGKELGKDIIHPGEFKRMNEAMISMVEWHKQTGSTEPLFGPVFRTGVNDGIGVMVLLPATADYRMGATTLNKVVHGTPALIQLQDSQLAQNFENLTYAKKLELAQKAMQERSEEIKLGKAKMNINWGGWGSVPWYLIHRQQLVQECVGDYDKSYVLSVNLGFLGSAYTLNDDYLKDNPRTFEQLRLPMFVHQLESSLAKIGELFGDKSDIVRTMMELSPDLIGHSMGGYLAIWAAKPSHERLPVIQALLQAGLSDFVADKPVIMGANYIGEKASWIDQLIKTPGFKNQVQLQSGIKGKFVRLGAGNHWDDYPSLASLREKLGATWPVRQLFDSFLTPKLMWDGDTIGPAHIYNYVWDRAYHQMCIRLLDTAEPVMSGNTITRVREKMLHLRVLLGSNEKILRHLLSGALVNEIVLPEENYIFQGNVAHHANLKEVAWMMKVRGVKKFI